ncbi:methyltransferase domain-containing protein [Sphingomonas changnyeongensis]|uniref:Methyltransferase domain-containing protein n=2 Tax=Sphingomonas changnyeongensis TaxID=2698679 RepID=A0A7Z2S6A6_9SPHN|nr:methyltransferase domain-containing protein [Sphingomonas changnyeongensis]
MDAIYRSQRHFYDLTRKYYLLGRDRLIAELAPPPGGTVLEIGCGTARNLIAAARAWPGARWFGIDISAAMLDTAGRAVRRAGLGGTVALARGDATAFDLAALFGADGQRPQPPAHGVDRVFMSYTLSMIPDWRAALDQAARALAPGGRLHIVDFGQQEGLPRWFRRLLFAWLARFDVSPRAGLEAELAALAARHGLTLRFTRLFRGYAWQARLDRPATGSAP